MKQGLGRPTSDNNHSVHALRCEERKHPFVLSELTLIQGPNSASSVKARMYKRNMFISYYYSYLSFMSMQTISSGLFTGNTKRPQDTKEARVMALLSSREVLGMYL